MDLHLAVNTYMTMMDDTTNPTPETEETAVPTETPVETPVETPATEVPENQEAQ